MSPPSSRATTRLPAYRMIADQLRNDILSGKMLPGKQLPSKGQLIELWQSSSFTIHTALQTLIKEGWIESVRGAGTYVAQPDHRFVCAGIYHGNDICSEETTPFARRIHVALLERFRQLGKETEVFMDTRLATEQTTLLPSLADAVLHRRIQCLVFPLANAANLPELSRLRMPTATLSSPSPTVINFDAQDMFRGGARRLAAAGCRTVGLISSYFVNPVEGRRDLFYDYFRQALHLEGMTTRPEWIRSPQTFVAVPDLEKRGYTEFNRLWDLPEKPDGLMIYPDTLARGAILGILERGVRTVTDRIKFIFHRNAHLDFLCPFPVIWAISDEDALAAELVVQIERQFEGQRTSSVLLPYSFKSDFDE